MPTFSTRLLQSLLLLLLGQAATAQTLDPGFHIPGVFKNAGVHDAIQQADGKWVAVGSFGQVENLRSKVGVVRYNTNGTLDQTFMQNAGGLRTATRVQQLANGQLLLLNGEWRQGSVQRSYLVRLNADGTLDPGLHMAPLPTPAPGYPASFSDMALQPDGKVLLVAHNNSGLGPADRVMRVLPDGTRDAGFAFDTGANGSVMAVLVQPDGRILLGGGFLARLQPNGTPDASFQLPSPLPITGQINGLALQPDGGVLVANAGSRGLLRLTPTGAPDPSFTLPTAYAGRECTQVKMLPNGQLAALFYMYRDSAGAYVAAQGTQLVRLHGSGGLDASFQPGDGPDWQASRVFGQANGQLLLAGDFSNFNGQRRSGLVLLQPTGAPDPVLTPRLYVIGEIGKVVRQADGKLLILGRFDAVDGQPTDGVARLHANGQVDQSFSWRYARSAVWEWQSLAVQPDGRLLVAGYYLVRQDAPPVLRRLLPDGAPDASFAASLQPQGTQRSVSFLQVQPDGRIVIGGAFTDQAGRQGLSRLLSTGQVDNSFTPPANYCSPLLLQADGKLMSLATRAAPATGMDLVRLLPNGAVDPGFVLNGTTSHLNWAAHVLQQASGQYLLAGTFGAGGIGASPALAQVSATGTENAAFNSPVQHYQLAVPELGIYTLVEQADGKLLIGGAVQIGSSSQANLRALLRLHPNGQLDASFDAAFLRQTPPYPYQTPFTWVKVMDQLVEPGGAIVVAGRFDQAGTQAASGLVRLLPAGILGVGAAPQSASRLQAWPVPAHDVLHLRLEGAAQPWQVSLLDALGKVVLRVPAAQAEMTLNTTALARGLYVLRVDYASGPVSRRIVLE